VATTRFEPAALLPIPHVEEGYVSLPECPVIARKLPWAKRQLIMWAVIGVLCCGMIAMYARSGSSSMTMIMPMSMFGVMGMMMWSQRGSANNQVPTGAQLAEMRRKFLADMDTVRDDLQADARRQHDRAMRLHPEPALLPGLVGSPQMWERSTAEQDYARHFGQVRIGVGTAALKKQIMPWGIQVTGQGDPAQHEPVALAALNALVSKQTAVHNIPITQSLTDTQTLTLAGDQETVLGLVRSIICQAALAHSPLDLKVMVITDTPTMWEWMKWLPHAADPQLAGTDLGGPGRLIFSSAAAMRDAVAEELRTARPVYRPGATVRPHWLVFNDADPDDDWDHITAGGAGANGCTFVQLTTEEENR
jgi:DNA segregation ATPase FtsK/SpoIIIE-like protein